VRVATLFMDPCPESIVRAMVKSVRKHMDCEIVQLTDMTTPKLDCVDSVQRLEGEIVSAVLAKHLSLLDGDTLYLDYDILVQEDVSKVFEQDFDLAITKREWKQTDRNILFAVCPHNVGVMFSRSQEFWRQVEQRYNSRQDAPSWYKFQIIVTEAMNALQHGFKFLELEMERYNYTPHKINEDLSGRAIVHYKGSRKAWMVPDEDAEDAENGSRLTEILQKSQAGVVTISPDHPMYK